MGADKVINRSEMDFKFWNEEGTRQNPKKWLRLGKAIHELTSRPSTSTKSSRPSWNPA